MKVETIYKQVAVGAIPTGKYAGWWTGNTVYFTHKNVKYRLIMDGNSNWDRPCTISVTMTGIEVGV